MKQSLWAIAAAACFSIMGAFVKFCTEDLGSFELVFYRSLFGAIFIAFVVAGSGGTLKTEHFRHHIVRSLLGVTSVALWFYALSQMHFGTCMTLIYTTPLFMALNFIILAKCKGESAPWAVVLAIVTGFIGICLVMKPGLGTDEFIPALICLGVALIDLAAYWQMKQMGRLNEPSYRIVFYFCVLGMVFAAVGTVATTGFHVPNLTGIAGLLGMGLFATLGQICTTRSYAYGNMLLSSCLGFSAVPFSVIFGVTLFDESVDPLSLFGMTLILIAGMSAAVATKRMEAKQEAAELASKKTS